MNTVDEAIEVLKALKEGKKLEVKLFHADARRWAEWDSPRLPDFMSYDYRVKKEPRVVYIKEAENTKELGNYAYSSEAKAWASGATHGVLLRKFAEVIEETK